MKKLVLIVLAGLILAPLVAAGQAMSDEFERAQSLYAQAQRMMRDKDYLAAIDTYSELVRGFKNSNYRDIYHYGLARAYYHAGSYEAASGVLANYETLFPKSDLLPYVCQLRANCDYRSHNLERAFTGYICAYETSRDNRLKMLSERSLFAQVEAGFIPSDSLLAMVPTDLRCRIKARVAFLMANRWDEQRVDQYLGECPKSLLKKDDQPHSKKEGLTIGVMLPLTGPYTKYGQSILDGAMMAAAMQKAQGVDIDLLAYDTKADNTTAAREAMLLAEAEVDMIVGPLLSPVAATAASALACHSIPLMVPAASQAGFTELSPYCFQMSVNMETIGRGLAQYAVKHRGMTTLAVITPATLDEMTMGEAFADEAERLGARILAVEKFRPDETDFGAYLIDIKEAILGPPHDSTFYLSLEGDTLKPGEMPVEFDGLFIPATEQQLFLLLPQILFYRVTTSYLGADEWNTPKVLSLGEKVLGDAVFYSNTAAMHYSAGYDKLSIAYDAKYASEPDRLVSLGYDAVNIFADAYRDGRRGAEQIGEYLKVLAGYNGASGSITFGRNRTNLDLPLFTLREGQVRPLIERPVVEEIPVDELPPDSLDTEYIKYEY